MKASIPRETIGQATIEGQPAVQAGHDRIVRAGEGDDLAGFHRSEHAGGAERLDTQDLRAGFVFVPAIVPNDRVGQRADAELHRHQVGFFFAPPRELVLDLSHDRGIAFHDPARDLFVARPGSVGNDEAACARHPRCPLDRVVIGARHDLDSRALARDAVDPRLGRARRHVNPRFQSEERSHVRDGATVIAVGRGSECERPHVARGVRPVRPSIPTVRRDVRAASRERGKRPMTPRES